jgi:hypothetical protein
VRRSRAYALGASLFGVIGIAAATRGDWLPAVFMFALAIAGALRANHEWNHENAEEGPVG